MRALNSSLFVALVLAGVCSTPASADSGLILAALKDGSSARVLVAAHRGAHDAAPENSLAALEAAIALGADIVEIDIRLTRDGVPVLMHDATVDRTTNGAGAVADMTFAAFSALRLRDGQGRLTDMHPPTLANALAAAKGRILVDLDLKTRDMAPILGRVAEAGMLDEALFFSGDAAHLQTFVTAAPEVMAMPRATSLETMRAVVTAFSPEVIHIDPTFNGPAVAEAVKPTDSRLWINALGDPDRLLAEGKVGEALAPLLAHGASIIQTDRPADVIAYLKEDGRR